jgi:hypothetical protein
VAHSRRAARVSLVHHTTCPKIKAKRIAQKVSLVRSGECVGRNNPKGRRLRPCAHTIVHPTTSHSPPPGIAKRCPPLHPRSHTCQGCTRSPSPSPRTALQARRQHLPALYSPTVTTPPMWLARTSKAASDKQVPKCGAQETRVAHSRRAARVSLVHHTTCPKIKAKRIAQKVSLVRSGECVGRNNPKGWWLRPCAHTLVHLTTSHSSPPGIPKRCPSLHPRSHTCQGCTRSPSPSPRTALQARRQHLPALYSPTVTTPPM